MPVRTLLLIAVLSLRSPLASAPEPTAADEALLREAGVSVEPAALLRLLRAYAPGQAEAGVIERLIASLGEADFERREKASRELVRLGQSAIDPLRKALEHTDAEVRQRARACLAEIGTPADAVLAHAACRILLHRHDPGAAAATLNFLPFAESDSAVDLLALLQGLRPQDAGEIEALRAALANKDPERRAAAALSLARHDTAAVRKTLADSEPLVRLRAAQGLLAAGDSSGLGQLAALLGDAPIEIAWQAEELLRWVMEDTARMTLFVDTGKAETRRLCRAAWERWLAREEPTLDWKTRLARTTRRPGLVLVCAEGVLPTVPTRPDTAGTGLALVGSDGTVRWSLRIFPDLVDGHLLPGGRFLVLTENSLRERTASGDYTWIFPLPVKDGRSCRPLAGGQVLLGLKRKIVVLSRGETTMSEIEFPASQDPVRLASGRLAVLGPRGLHWPDGDKIGRPVPLGPPAPVGLARLHLLTDGRLLIHTLDAGRIWTVEGRPDGVPKEEWGIPWKARASHPLRNGNLLALHGVAEGQAVLQEWAMGGRVVGEIPLPKGSFHFRGCLEELRVGLDHPRPADFEVSTAAYRLASLRSPDPAVRRRTAGVLDQVAGPVEAAFPHLSLALSDEAEDVRAAARESLKRIGYENADTLIKVWTSQAEPLRGGAARALAEIKWREEWTVPPALKVLHDPKAPAEQRGQAIHILTSVNSARWDTQVIEGLVLALRTDSDSLCLAAVRALGPYRVGAWPAVSLLLDILRPAEGRTRPAKLRRETLAALDRIGADGGALLPILMEIVGQPKEDETLRVAAVKKLQKIDPNLEKSLPLLRELLMQRGVGKPLLEAVGEAMAQSGERSVSALEWAVRHGNQDSALVAIRSLGRIGPKAAAAIPALKEAAEEDDPAIRDAARIALQSVDRSR
jgi:HEAT repeat protein